jgi:outer membrane immunogenic protein
MRASSAQPTRSKNLRGNQCFDSAGNGVQNMKRSLLATVSMVALTTVARAADMPPKAPVLAPAPAANWTGGYVGIQGGVLRHDASFDFSSTGVFVGDPGGVENRTGGVVGGLVGYNWQRGHLAYGLEGDWNRVGAKATPRSIFTSSSYEIDWLATVRGRVGVALDATLFYVTGGAAFGRVKDTFSFIDFDGSSVLASYAKDKTKAGWTLGAGVEHMFAPHWTARAEFRYTDLGKTSVACAPGIVSCITSDGFFPDHVEFRNRAAMALLGLNYKFGDGHAGGWAQARSSTSPPAPTWAGTYIGIQGGLAHHDASFADRDGFFSNNAQPSFIGRSRTGGTVGGLLGHNWQTGSFVYGVEGDWSWVGAKAEATTPFIGDEVSTSFDAHWLATARGRAGLAFDSTLLYTTGGLAVGHIRNRIESSDPIIGPFESFSQRQTKVGWTAGVGAEHMFSPHWTVRAEFRYVDLGKKEAPVCFSTAGNVNACRVDTFGYRGEFSNKLMLGLVGLAYKF